MPEKVKESTYQALILGGVLVLTGAAALLGELNPATADAILKLWPAGIIGLGVALLFRPETEK